MDDRFFIYGIITLVRIAEVRGQEGLGSTAAFRNAVKCFYPLVWV
jgi:hypothetical protein